MTVRNKTILIIALTLTGLLLFLGLFSASILLGQFKELERELLRKDRALAETAALLVLSKKVAAIFNKGEVE